MPSSCSFAGCSRPVHSTGLCVGHHYQRRRGQPLRELGSRKTKNGDGVRPLVPNPDLSGTMLVLLSKGLMAIVDEADAAAVGRHNWLAHLDHHSKTAYARTNISRPDGSRTAVTLHQFLWSLWGLPKASRLDHENRNGLDCRRTNLRPATPSQNGSNRAKPKNNRSGFKGVSWHSQRRKWCATIGAARKHYHLGLFEDPAEAARAYAEAAARLYGQFACVD